MKCFFLKGSNGEYCYLSPEERVEMIRAVKQHASGTIRIYLLAKLCYNLRKY